MMKIDADDFVMRVDTILVCLYGASTALIVVLVVLYVKEVREYT